MTLSFDPSSVPLWQMIAYLEHEKFPQDFIDSFKFLTDGVNPFDEDKLNILAHTLKPDSLSDFIDSIQKTFKIKQCFANTDLFTQQCLEFVLYHPMENVQGPLSLREMVKLAFAHIIDFDAMGWCCCQIVNGWSKETFSNMFNWICERLQINPTDKTEMSNYINAIDYITSQPVEFINDYGYPEEVQRNFVIRWIYNVLPHQALYQTIGKIETKLLKLQRKEEHKHQRALERKTAENERKEIQRLYYSDELADTKKGFWFELTSF